MPTRRITIRAGLAATVTLLALAPPANADSVQALRSPEWLGPLRPPSLAATVSASKAGDATPADTSAALAQERDYSSYGTPDRAPAPSARAGELAADGFNWDDAAIGAGGAFVIVILGGAERHCATATPDATRSSRRDRSSPVCAGRASDKDRGTDRRGRALFQLWESAEARQRNADDPAHTSALEASGMKRLASGMRSRVFNGAELRHAVTAGG